jgi:hypothetical protein
MTTQRDAVNGHPKFRFSCFAEFYLFYFVNANGSNQNMRTTKQTEVLQQNNDRLALKKKRENNRYF